MAHFYGEIQGTRGTATRMGSEESGFWGHIRGWDIGVRVDCIVDKKTGLDELHIIRTGGSNGGTMPQLIAVLRQGGKKRLKSDFRKPRHKKSFVIELRPRVIE